MKYYIAVGITIMVFGFYLLLTSPPPKLTEQDCLDAAKAAQVRGDSYEQEFRACVNLKEIFDY